MASARFGSTVPLIFATLERPLVAARGQSRRATLQITTSSSNGTGSVTFPVAKNGGTVPGAYGIQSVTVTATGSGTTAPFTTGSVSSFTAAGVVNVISISLGSAGASAATSALLSVTADFA